MKKLIGDDFVLAYQKVLRLALDNSLESRDRLFEAVHQPDWTKVPTGEFSTNALVTWQNLLKISAKAKASGVRISKKKIIKIADGILADFNEKEKAKAAILEHWRLSTTEIYPVDSISAKGLNQKPQRPQFFLTTIIGDQELCDLEILTLPNYSAPPAVSDLFQLRHIILAKEVREFQVSEVSEIDEGGVSVCRAALRNLVLSIGNQNRLPPELDKLEVYADNVFDSYSVPIMNSPISGSTLLRLAESAGSGAAFMAAFPHPEVGHITIYFLIIGGTRIMLGAAGGISAGLNKGLKDIISRWFRDLGNGSDPKKTKKRKA